MGANERLLELVRSNDRLMAELEISRENLAFARNYLSLPGCNVKFGKADLERCESRRAGLLAQLRANRIEAIRLAGMPDEAEVPG